MLTIKNNFLKLEKENLVANHSFEQSLLVRPDGWRPVILEVDAYTVFDKNQAQDKMAYLECPANAKVQQSIRAQGGEQFSFAVWIKGKGTAHISYAFVNQGQKILTQKQHVVKVNRTWKRPIFYSGKAPLKTWKLRIMLGAAKKSTVQFDNVLGKKNTLNWHRITN